MSKYAIAKRAMVALLAGVALSFSAAAQNRPAAQTNIFNTKDFRQDRALWTDPAYYRNNTPGQLRGMALNITPYENSGQVGASRLYGSLGTGKAGATNYTSPYFFKTAMEQYQAWLKDAKGGTKHTKDTIPDWSGYWDARGGFGGGQGPASDVVKFLTPKYREYYVQEMKAASEGRAWSANSFCLPAGFFATLGAEEFIVTPKRVWTTTSGNGWNATRWIYTDAGHVPEAVQFPKWNGESIGFWNGDTLIVHTNQLKGWKGGISEFTDDLETVEKYRRVGDTIEGEITLYNPEVFTGPLYTKLTFVLKKSTKLEEVRPLYNTCTDSNGPSPAVFLDQKGFLNERIPGEPGFDWSPADPRPWGTWISESDKRYKAYLASGGKPPVQADVTPPSTATGSRPRN